MKIPQDIKRYVLKRRLLRIALWLLSVGIISLIFFTNLDSVLDSSYAKIRIAIYVVVIILTVFVFGIPKLLFKKSFIGKIVWLEVVTKVDSDMRMGFIESLYRRVWVNAIIELENGKRIHKEIASKRTQRLTVPSKFQRGADDSFLAKQYSVGDTVIFIAGTKYCQVYSENKENLTCVVCGEFSQFDNTKCDNCGHTILKG